MRIILIALLLSNTGFAQEREEVLLPIGEVYNQGATNWCWAYSAFHTAREYYLRISAPNQSQTAWKEALSSINTASGFKTFMGTISSPQITGNPIQFIEKIQKKKNLPNETWTPIYPSDKWSVRRETAASRGEYVGAQMPTAKIFDRVHEDLRKGVPVSYCNPPHCVMIYGAVFDGNTPKKYAIADSSGGKTYLADATKIWKDLDLVTVVE